MTNLQIGDYIGYVDLKGYDLAYMPITDEEKKCFDLDDDAIRLVKANKDIFNPKNKDIICAEYQIKLAPYDKKTEELLQVLAII